MKKIYLHIGTEKTGTTSIQKALFTYKSKGSGSLFYYPKEGIVSNHHFQIAKSNFSETLLLDEIESASEKTIVLSSEHFCMIREPKLIASLQTLLKDYPVEVILYLRNPKSYLTSLYGEHIKWGGKISIDQFYEKSRWRFDYVSLIKRWSSVFGEGNVSFFDYDNVGNVVEHFFNKIGAASALENEVSASSAENRSDPRYFLEVMKRFNSAFPGADARKFLALARPLQKLVPVPDELKKFDWKVKQPILRELEKAAISLNKTYSVDYFDLTNGAQEVGEASDIESTIGDYMLALLQKRR